MKTHLLFLLTLFAISCSSLKINEEYKGKDLQKEKITFVNAHQIREYGFFQRGVQKELTDDVSFYTGENLKRNPYQYTFDHCYNIPTAYDLESFFVMLDEDFELIQNNIPESYKGLYKDCPSDYVLLIKHNGFYETTGHQIEKGIIFMFVNIFVELLDGDDDDDDGSNWNRDNDPDVYIPPPPPDIGTDFSYVIIDRVNDKVVMYDREVYEDDPASEQMMRRHIRHMINDINDLKND